eukprot:TRINITY_DN80284_c0_g1_i1.p1 TRINITY_DN80284_c0_g1~~TRINITY_DN80284_c0_g1_i1.p1  ORF type:complete len:202 (+),score=30.42 TRINITY_DN80284_c0_g1_i1:93-698(+)
MMYARCISLLAVIFIVPSKAGGEHNAVEDQAEKQVHSQVRPMRWSLHPKHVDDLPSPFLLLVPTVLVCIGLIRMVAKSRRVKKIEKNTDDAMAVTGKANLTCSTPSTCPVHDEELGSLSTSTPSGSGGWEDDEDENQNSDLAHDPFSDRLPATVTSPTSAELMKQGSRLPRTHNLEAGLRVGANPFEDDLTVMPSAKGKAD